MKIIITESQVEAIFNNYLKKHKPELFELSKFPMKRADKKTIYGYEFEIEDTLILIFEYLLFPDGGLYFPENIPTDAYPKLRITGKTREEMVNIFGNRGIGMLVKWFENHYKLPVNSVIDY